METTKVLTGVLALTVVAMMTNVATGEIVLTAAIQEESFTVTAAPGVQGFQMAAPITKFAFVMLPVGTVV